MALSCRLGRALLSRTCRPQPVYQAIRTLAEVVDGEDDRMRFPGQRPGQHARFITEPTFLEPDSAEPIAAYRVMRRDGTIIDPNQEPELDRETVVKMYQHMTKLYEMDKFLNSAQRQGRISFYMTTHGEEAVLIGSAAALNDEDVVFAQYREVGVLMWRGFTIQQCVHQCFGNIHDIGKGKQMPVHYGSNKLNYVTISSPLATQLPQATGAAYALKRSKPDLCAITYFGDGAASEGDAHAAMNFAATLECPMIFLCRNNGYAISTPTSDQYRGDGIASRGIGYGINTLRVDGNDIFAVYNATKKARQMALEQQRPVLVEAMTYRVGHHSTSDDSSAYRPKEEQQSWKDFDQPIDRLKRYMADKGWMTDEEHTRMCEEYSQEVLNAMKASREESKPPMEEMFGDVYTEPPKRLQEQLQELRQHVARNEKEYPLSNFK